MDGFRYENKGSNLILYVEREVDHHLASKIREKIDAEIDRGSIRNIIFDFEGVSFMDSSGIGMIMGRYKKMQFFGGKVLVSGIEKGVDRIFKLSGLYKLISKYPTLDSALESLK